MLGYSAANVFLLKIVLVDVLPLIGPRKKLPICLPIVVASFFFSERLFAIQTGHRTDDRWEPQGCLRATAVLEKKDSPKNMVAGVLEKTRDRSSLYVDIETYSCA